MLGCREIALSFLPPAAAKVLPGAGKGDRKWQRSKLPQVDVWLRGAVGVVAREASRAGRIDAEEFLEDFLFAYGTVADAEPEEA